jgi:hypothetical protein
MNTTVNILECAIMVKVVRRFDGAHPDNTNSDRTVLYAIGLTPGPYIDRGQASRVGTSQPQAFAFDVHAQTHATELWSPGFGVRRTWGEKRKDGREKEATQDPRRKAYAESRKTNLLAAKHFAKEPRL